MTQPRKSAAAVQRVITPELVRCALASIPPDVERDVWVRLAMAIKSELGEAGFDAWNEWSATSTAYVEAAARDTWRSVKAGGAVTIATLFKVAQQYGFKFPQSDPVQAPALSSRAKAETERLARERAARLDAERVETEQRQEKAAQEARRTWKAAKPQGQSPYLERKCIQAHGVRFTSDGAVLVPLRDLVGTLRNVQCIAPDGDKRFLPGGLKSGLLHWIGDPAAADVLLLAEGYATAATLHEATGRPVAVAFDAGNLANHVAVAVREKFPTALLIVCGDEDLQTQARTGKNPGRQSAAKAVRAVLAQGSRAAMVFPVGLPEGASDFNDLAAHAGIAAVQALIEAAVSQARPATPVATTRASGWPDAGEEPTPVRDRQPLSKERATRDEAATKRPRDQFFVNEEGVYHVARDNNGEDKPPMWLCKPLQVVAITRDESDNRYGYLIEFVNRDGNMRRWAAPAALFGGDSNDWAAKLRDMGLHMATGPRARNLLGQYIDSRNPTDRATCTDRVGWHGDVYVQPSRFFGTKPGRRFVFQTDSTIEDNFQRAGRLEDWRRTVAAPCSGNSRLVFAICCALAGPLVAPLGVQTGGFHLVGDSSLGKTTALLLAASVFGSPRFKQQWRATDNGLESVAVHHSDCILILDEIGQADGRMIGDASYMLANEAEKIRNTKSLMARQRRVWRLVWLSSGEKGLADHMLEAGKKPNEGQLVRMPSIPADAGKGLGMFETLHDAPPGESAAKAFAEQITRAAATSYGTCGDAWIEHLAARYETLADEGLPMMRRMEADWVPAHSHAQVWRVATRFALVGTAGEIATRAGITGWVVGEAERAARSCFEAWLSSRGHSRNGEEVAMLRQVQAFLEANGAALFTPTNRALDDHRPNTPLRCGFRREVDLQGTPIRIDSATSYVDHKSIPESSDRHSALTEYMVLPEAFKRQIAKGYDHSAVARMLKKRGHLIHEKDRLTNKQRLPTMGLVSCYHIRASILEDDGSE